MFNQLTALGYGVMVFGITIGVGVVVLQRFSGSVAICGNDTNITSSDYGVWNDTTGTCSNSTASEIADPTNAEWTNVNYMQTQLGTTGLAGWTPAIIAFAIGMLFLGSFLIGKGKGRSY